MKIKTPTKAGAPVEGSRAGTSVLLDKTQRTGEDDLFEKGGGSTLSVSKPVIDTSKPGVFAQAVLGCLRQHPRAVAAVMAALMLPALIGPAPHDSLGTIEDRPVASAFIETRALVTPVPGVEASPLVAYVDSVRSSLQAKGLPTRAEGVTISVLMPPGTPADEVIRAFGHERFGVAPGATLPTLELEGQVFSPRHEALKQAFERETQAVRAGAKPSDQWLANAVAIELFETAGAIHALHGAKAGHETQVVVVGRSTSPRSIARELLAHLRAAPPGSAAAAFLAGLPTANEDGTRVDDWQGLTRKILEVMDTEAGARRIGEGKRALRAQYDEARDKGLLVLRPSGDLRRDGDEEEHRSARDFADGFEAPIAVGATGLPSGAGAPTLLASTSTGWMSLAGPGSQFPSAHRPAIQGSLAATIHVAGAAALMLKVAPGLSPDQLETLLTDPRVLLDQAGTRDGLGFLLTSEVVSLAREAHEGKISFTSDRSRFLFEKAVKGGPELRADHPYVQHLEHLRAELKARGLPVRADGVKIFVVEPSWDDHVGAVSRTIAQPKVGLAPGADVRVIVDSDWYDDREKALAKQDVAHDQAVLAGASPTKQSVIDNAERQILSRAADVRRVAQLAPGDETVLLNMSYGTTSATIAENLIDLMESAPKGSSADQRVEQLGETRGERDRAMIEWVSEILASPEAQAQIESAMKALAQELRAARERGVLAFTSAGNSREEWMTKPLHSAHVEAGLDDLITVAAMKLNDPRTPKDDHPTNFSSEGHIIFGAPGEDLPVGLRGDADGTSFASPYGLSVAALMLKENGALSPDQLEALLYRPGSTFNVPGHLDGLGAIDVVSAVQSARDAKSTAFEWLPRADYLELRKLRLQQELARPLGEGSG